jgi:hypothetical protein
MRTARVVSSTRQARDLGYNGASFVNFADVLGPDYPSGTFLVRAAYETLASHTTAAE